MTMHGKTCLVTGAAGFIGHFLSHKLLEQGWRVIGTDNLNAYYDIRLKRSRLELMKPYPGFTFIEADLVDKERMLKLFADHRPNIAVNLAAQAGVRYSLENPDAYIQSNIVGFFNILEACRHYPVKHLLFASSSSIYGNQEKVPFSVNDPTDRPISLYAATKKSDELMAYTYSHLYRIPATGLRFFTVYGPFGRPDMAYFKFANKIFNGETIQVYNNGDMLRDFTYVDDIVEGISHMLNHPPKLNEEHDPFKVYNIGNNHPVRLMKFIEILEDAIGRKAEKEYLPMQMGDVYQTYADIDDLEKDFGYHPSTTLEDGLAAFAKWYKNYYHKE